MNFLRNFLENLKKECTNVKIFDTICNATHKRQTEAAEIAGKVDVMVVVGDRKSANTKHLTEICKKRCSRVHQIENAGRAIGRSVQWLLCCGTYGRASTPAGIIKEVYATMSEEIKAAEGMDESFEELLNQLLNFKYRREGHWHRHRYHPD